jgi:ubiquinone/menaquinone biosynthesis C-methylase UbiE
MDMCEKIDFPNQTADLVIDKGLLDAVLCGEDFAERLNKMLSECWRVLKPRGYLLILS